MKAISIVGARPQFVKLAPVSRAFDALRNSHQVSHQIVNTGQHYDRQMSSVFFDELNIPRPDIDLGIGSGSHAVQTGTMMQALETCFTEMKPDVVLVYGDTNSTLAACLAAAKIHIPTAHIEAGLRSFNRQMPEEINRVVADHCCDRLYVPTPTGMSNLANENLTDRSFFCGDVMRDVVEHNRHLAAERSQIMSELALEPAKFALLTLHRPVNTTPEALIPLLRTLDDLATDSLPIVFPVHPRARQVLQPHIDTFSSALRFVEPLAYLDMLCAVESAHMVLTDSGGLQKEAAFLNTRCVTLREETEWIETIELGVNCLVGQNEQTIRSAFANALAEPNPFSPETRHQLDLNFGDGHAAERIAQDVLDAF